MRKLFTLKLIRMGFVLIVISQTAFAQLAKTYLDINDVKALYVADGGMFSDPVSNPFSGYLVPKPQTGGKALSTISTNSLMIGGLDALGNLHTAGMSYRNLGTDFWPGPLKVTTGEAHDPANWNRIWKVSKSTIDYHKSNYQNANYIVPQEILEWPGNGPAGCAAILAPFFDRDGDNLYEPASGDYPLIKGDQAVYFIFNDNVSTHTNHPGGLPLKIEVHGMAWAISSTNKFIDQTTFINYAIFNRSTENYFDVKAGFFTDFDLGGSIDDYIATDTSRNMLYTYNADSIDGKYGANPPVQALVFLNNKLGSTFAFTDQGQMGVNALPRDATELYRYLRGYWADGQIISYGTSSGRGGSTETKFMFDGDLCPASGWRETQMLSDRYTIASISLDTLLAGSSASFDIALVFARGDSGITTSQCKLEEAVDYVSSQFKGGALTSVNNINTYKELSVYPNPVKNKSIVKYINPNEEVVSLTITDMQGRVLVSTKIIKDFEINADEFKSGIYIIRINSGVNSYYSKFVVN